MEFQAADRREAYDRTRDKRLAWCVAMLSRQQRLPSMSAWMGNVGRSAPAKQTAGQMKQMLHIIAGSIGGRVTTRKDRGE